MKLFRSTFTSSILAACAVFSAPASAENLFSPVDRIDMRESLFMQTEHHHRSIKHYKMKTSLVKQTSKTLTFNLNDKLVQHAKQVSASRNTQGNLLWQGSLERGMSGSRRDSRTRENSVVLVKTRKGVTATIRTNGRLFKISPAGNGVHTVTEVDESRMPDDHPPGAMQRLDSTSNIEINALDIEALGIIAEAAPTPDIRVLVPYTAKARQLVGDIDGLIELAIAETNTGYQNSGVNATITLAHAFEVDYNETNDMLRDLNYLIDTNDGVMPALQ